jgi:hypothetical protein
MIGEDERMPVLEKRSGWPDSGPKPITYETFGAIPASTDITAYTIGTGVDATWNAWQQIAASIAKRAIALVVLLESTSQSTHYQIQVGWGSVGNEIAVATFHNYQVRYTIQRSTEAYGPFPIHIPAGSRLCVRGRSNYYAGMKMAFYLAEVDE